MTEERFKNYIKEVEKGTTCSAFLKENKEFISKVSDDEDFQRNFQTHKALSNIKRFTIYQLLKKRPMCTCALATLFDVSEGTITHHLKILEKADLIVGRKEGYFTRYYTNEELVSILK